MNAEDHLLTGAYALDAVDDGELESFEEHLGECTACVREVAEFHETAALLALTTRRPVPAGLFERVMVQVRDTPQLPPLIDGPAPPIAPVVHPAAAPTAAPTGGARERAGQRWFGSGSRSRRLLVAAAVIVIVAVGAVAVGRVAGNRADDFAVVAGAAGARSFQLAGEPGYHAQVAIDPSGRAAVKAADLPAVADDKAYELWFIDPQGAHRATTFRPDGQGQATVTFDAPVRSPNALGVTVEAAAGADQPTGSILMSATA